MWCLILTQSVLGFWPNNPEIIGLFFVVLTQTKFSRQRFCYHIDINVFSYSYFVLFSEVKLTSSVRKVPLSCVLALQDSSLSVATLLSVVTLVLTGQPIAPVNIFVLLGFMDIARIATCRYFPSALLQTNDAYASLGRIEDFLLLENIPTISRGQISKDTSNTDSSSIKATNGLSDQERKKEAVFNFHQVRIQEKHSALCVTSLTHRHT